MKKIDLSKLIGVPIKQHGIKKHSKTKRRKKKKLKNAISFEIFLPKQKKQREKKKKSTKKPPTTKTNELTGFLSRLEIDENNTQMIDLITDKNVLHDLQREVMKRAYHLLKNKSNDEIEIQLHKIFGFKKESIKRISSLFNMLGHH